MKTDQETMIKVQVISTISLLLGKLSKYAEHTLTVNVESALTEDLFYLEGYRDSLLRSYNNYLKSEER